MVESYVFRKAIFLPSYFVVCLVSFMYMDTLYVNGTSICIKLLGIAIFVLSAIGIAKIHSMYPKKHDRPSDFPRLLREGAYSIVRHPFYALTIVNQISVSIMLLSIEGIIASILCIPLWIILIVLEERELVEYWGKEYLDYRNEVPALIPLPWRRRKRKKS